LKLKLKLKFKIKIKIEITSCFSSNSTLNLLTSFKINVFKGKRYSPMKSKPNLSSSKTVNLEKKIEKFKTKDKKQNKKKSK
jgi:hypothetical protein